jgi:hypothetical protein
MRIEAGFESNSTSHKHAQLGFDEVQCKAKINLRGITV